MPNTITQTTVTATSAQRTVTGAAVQTLLNVSVSSSTIGTPIPVPMIDDGRLTQNGGYRMTQNAGNRISQ